MTKWIIFSLIWIIGACVCVAAVMLGMWAWYEYRDRKWFEEQEAGGAENA